MINPRRVGRPTTFRSRTDPPLYAYSTTEPGLDEIGPRTVAHRIAGMVDVEVYLGGHASGMSFPELAAACGNEVTPGRSRESNVNRRFWHFIADPSLVGLPICRKCAARKI